MSDDSLQNAQLVADYSDDQVQYYMYTAVLCLLAYEYFITLDREMKFFWKRTITRSSILFIVNRYWSLVFAALLIIPDPTTQKTLGLLQYFIWALFSTMRAYALLSSGTRRGRWSISTLVLLSSLAPVVNSLGLSHHIRSSRPVCHMEGNIQDKQDSRPGNFPLEHLVQRWVGTLYFRILAMLNILHFSFTMSSVPDGPPGSEQRSDAPVLSSILNVKSELQ
ncbi:hypothetical protein C8Q74DRAFT_1218323 [Fomes fomentarius]|nr:hypothetical protein C8Q74DRAFT_1218323 [Fomes fomentarius]